MDSPGLDMLFCPLKRKHLIKLIKDNEMCLDNILNLPPTRLLYGSYIIAECLKLGIQIEEREKAVQVILNVVRLVIRKSRDQKVLCPDFASILKSCFTGMSVSNKMNPIIQCKEIYSDDFVEDIISFIEEYKIQREDLLPIIQFVMNHKRLNSDIVNVVSSGFDCFSECNLDIWLNCATKILFSYRSSDTGSVGKCRDLKEKILDRCLSKLKQTDHSSHFLYLDTIVQCVKYQNGLSLEKAIEVFNINIDYSDGRGFGLSKISLELNQILLKAYPELIEKVELLALEPWYSKCTHKYKGLWFKYCNQELLNDSFVNTMLNECLSVLQYNRINHDVIRTVETLFERGVRDHNCVMMLETCMRHAREPYSEKLRLISVYILPLLYKTCPNPPTLDHFLAQNRDLRQTAAFIYSYPGNLSNYPVICEKLSQSGSSDIQCLWITTVTKQVLSHQILLPTLLHSLSNIRHIACPALRQQTIACFRKLSAKFTLTFNKLRKNEAKECNNEMIALRNSMIKLFKADIKPGSSYHVKMLSLTFFDIITKDGLLGDVICGMKEDLRALLEDDDSEVLMLSSRILSRVSQDEAVTDLAQLTSNVESCLTNTGGLNGVALITLLIDHVKCASVSNVLGVECGEREVEDVVFEVLGQRLIISIHNITDAKSCISVSTRTTMSILQHLVGELHDPSLVVPLVEPLVAFVMKMLNMTSHEIHNGYGAASFEETSVLLQSELGESVSSSAVIWKTLSLALALLGDMSPCVVRHCMACYTKESSTDELEGLIESIGDILLHSVFRCRHRSVIIASSTALRTFTRTVGSNPVTSQLPLSLINTILSSLSSQSSLSRRSAGLPDALESIVTPSLCEHVVTSLIAIASRPFHNLAEQSDCPQVHAIHILTVLYSSASLRIPLLPYVTEIIKICYIGFEHAWWVIRNASLLLFSEINNYIVGHKTIELPSGYRSNMSISEFKSFYADIYTYIISNLSTAATLTCSQLPQPSVFLSLSLLSNLYPSPHVDDEDKQFSKYLIALLQSRSTIRNVVARTIPLCCSVKTCSNEAVKILSELCNHANLMGHNMVNGGLSFVLEFVKCITFTEECLEGLVSQLCKIVQNQPNLLEYNQYILVNICKHLHKKYPSEKTQSLLSKIVNSSNKRLGFTAVNNSNKTQGFPSSLITLLAQSHLQLGSDYSSLNYLITQHLSHLEEELWTDIDEKYLLSTQASHLTEWIIDQILLENTHVLDPQFYPHVLRFIFSVLNVRYKSVREEFVQWVFGQSTDQHVLPLVVLLSCKYGVEMVRADDVIKQVPQTHQYKGALLYSFNILPVPHLSPPLRSLVNQVTVLLDDEEFSEKTIMCLQSYLRNIELIKRKSTEDILPGVSEEDRGDFCKVRKSDILTNREIIKMIKSQPGDDVIL